MVVVPTAHTGYRLLRQSRPAAGRHPVTGWVAAVTVSEPSSADS